MANLILSGIGIPELYEDVRKIIRDEIANIKMESPPKIEELIDINEATKVIHKAKQTIYQYCSKKNIPHIKSGGKIYFKRSELLSWVENGAGYKS
jgi:excisionase family DNA binding protein